MDVATYVLAKNYTKKTLEGAGAIRGKSAYEIALENGFVGSETDWLNSLKGPPGTYELGHGLKLGSDNKTISVNMAPEDFSGDNSLPVAASALQSTVGNIEILLATI